MCRLWERLEVFRVRQIAVAIALIHLVAVLGLPPAASNQVFSSLVGVSQAHAQDAKPKKRRSLFSILFGKKKAKKKPAQKLPFLLLPFYYAKGVVNHWVNQKFSTIGL